MITSKDCPAFGGVYKLAAVLDEKTGAFIPKIKLSENTEKITNPGNKKILRIYDKETGKIRADLICLIEEEFDPEQDMIIFDQLETWKKTKIKGGTYTCLLYTSERSVSYVSTRSRQAFGYSSEYFLNAVYSSGKLMIQLCACVPLTGTSKS